MNTLAKRVLKAWDRFWFRRRPALDLAICRVLILAYLPIADRRLFTFDTPFFQLEPARWQPIGIFALLLRGPISEGTFRAIQIVWIASLCTALLGLFTRISMIAYFVSFIFVYAYEYCFGTVYHGYHMMTLVLGILAFSRCGDALSLDALLFKKKKSRARELELEKSGAYGWPIRLAQVVICLGYFSGGVQKLKDGGVAWAFSDNLAIKFFMQPALAEMGNWFLQQKPWMTQALAAYVLFVVELAAPLALIGPRIGAAFVFIWASFHFGVFMTMSGHKAFFTQIVVAAAVFFPLGSAWRRMSERLAIRAAKREHGAR